MLSLFFCLVLHAGLHIGLYDIPPQTSVIPRCLKSSISALSWHRSPSLVWPWPAFYPISPPPLPTKPLLVDSPRLLVTPGVRSLYLFTFAHAAPSAGCAFALLCLPTSTIFQRSEQMGVLCKNPSSSPRLELIAPFLNTPDLYC